MVVQAGEWPDQAEVLLLARKALTTAVDVAGLKLPPKAELCIVLSDDNHLQKLNRDWRQIDKPTNVLSFPVSQIEVGEMPEMLLGDIVLAQETIAKEAVDFEIPFDNHIVHLVIHGFLHIFGYDHTEDSDAEVMENLERLCLQMLNISDPHATDAEASGNSHRIS